MRRFNGFARDFTDTQVSEPNDGWQRVDHDCDDGRYHIAPEKHQYRNQVDERGKCLHGVENGAQQHFKCVIDGGQDANGNAYQHTEQ